MVSVWAKNYTHGGGGRGEEEEEGVREGDMGGDENFWQKYVFYSNFYALTTPSKFACELNTVIKGGKRKVFLPILRLFWNYMKQSLTIFPHPAPNKTLHNRSKSCWELWFCINFSMENNDSTWARHNNKI